MLDLLGWAATGIFAGSYLCRKPGALQRLQAVAAFVWIGYGFLIHARPIVVANVIVVVLAAYSSWRERGGSAPATGPRLTLRQEPENTGPD